MITGLITHHHVPEPDSAGRAADTGGSRGGPAPRVDGAAPSFLGRGVAFNYLHPRMGGGQRPTSWCSQICHLGDSLSTGSGPTAVVLYYQAVPGHGALPQVWLGSLASSPEPCMTPPAVGGDSPCSDRAGGPLGSGGVAVLMANLGFCSNMVIGGEEGRPVLGCGDGNCLLLASPALGCSGHHVQQGPLPWCFAWGLAELWLAVHTDCTHAGSLGGSSCPHTLDVFRLLPLAAGGTDPGSRCRGQSEG